MAPERAVLDSVTYLLDRPLATAAIRDLSWRLAGNLKKLRAGKPVIPWSLQTELEWVPIEFLAMRQARTARDRPGGEFLVQVLAGSPCPIQFPLIMATGFWSMLARRIGFTRRKGPRPYSHMAELVRLRCTVLLDPARCRPGQLGLDKPGCSGSMLDYNRMIIGLRQRTFEGQLWRCPRNYQKPCYRCHVGYDECDAGTHPHTIEGVDHAHSDPSPGVSAQHPS